MPDEKVSIPLYFAPSHSQTPPTPPSAGYHIPSTIFPHGPHSTSAAAAAASPSQPSPPLQLAAPFEFVVCTLVASPGANMTGTAASPDARTSSGVSSGLLRASHDVRFSLAGMLLVTEMGRSKMV